MDIHSVISAFHARRIATAHPRVRAASRPRRLRTRGQALVELAIVLPVLLLVVGGAVDFGRLFFARVAIENAAKEGAFFGAANPRCDIPRQACADPGTVRWHAENEATGLPVVVTAACLRGGSSIAVTDCEEDDTYRVEVTHEFHLVTPILSGAFGSGIHLATAASSIVLNDAFDPNAAPVGP